MELSLFQKYQQPIVTKITNTRQLIIADILEEINKERPSTYKDKNNKKRTLQKIVSKKDISYFCFKISHCSEEDLTVAHRNALKSKLEKGKPYSFVFFGSLKVK
jgi:hypothetical protein